MRYLLPLFLILLFSLYADRLLPAAFAEDELDAQIEKITSKRRSIVNRRRAADDRLDKVSRMTDLEIQEFVSQNVEELGAWLKPLLAQDPMRTSTDAIVPLPPRLQQFLDVIALADYTLNNHGSERESAAKRHEKARKDFSDFITKKMRRRGLLWGVAGGTLGVASFFVFGEMAGPPIAVVSTYLSMLVGWLKVSKQDKKEHERLSEQYDVFASLKSDRSLQALVLMLDVFDEKLGSLLPTENAHENAMPVAALLPLLSAADPCSALLNAPGTEHWQGPHRLDPRTFLEKYRSERQKLLTPPRREKLPGEF